MARKSKVVFDAWDTYVSETEEGPIFISFDDEAARNDLTHTLQHCACIVINIKKPNANGGPVQPEANHLWEMEDALCEELSTNGVSCRLVGRLTYRGKRTIVFQLDDRAGFRPIADRWRKENADYQIKIVEEKGWDYFDENIRPTKEDWLFIADNSVVSKLVEVGSDPTKPHSLEFVFLGDGRGLKAVASELRERGYAPLGKLDFAGGQIVMVKSMPLNVKAIFGESKQHARLAKSHGVQYDGWGTAVVK